MKLGSSLCGSPKVKALVIKTAKDTMLVHRKNTGKESRERLAPKNTVFRGKRQFPLFPLPNWMKANREKYSSSSSQRLLPPTYQQNLVFLVIIFQEEIAENMTLNKIIEIIFCNQEINKLLFTTINSFKHLISG